LNKDKTGNERYRRWYANHREKIQEQRRQVYEQRKKDGLCPRCAKSSPDGGLCEDCLSKARVWNKK
jgi:hypothetical protein